MHPSCFVARTEHITMGIASPSEDSVRDIAYPGEKAFPGNTSQVSTAFLLPFNENPGETDHPALLQVSDDLSLAKSRQPLLRIAGYQVHTCESRPSEWIEKILPVRFAAAVICQSVKSDSSTVLSNLLADWNPGISIVRISKRAWLEEDQAYYKVLLQAPIPPVEFVSTMMRLRART